MLIVETLHRLHRWAWIERRLFEIVGSWSTSTPEPEVARWFATAAHHHAWRSSLFADRLPVLHDVAAPSPPAAWSALLDAMASPSATTSRLCGLGQVVLPALEASYAAAAASWSEVCDGPVHRALSLALPDAREDRRSASALLAVAPDDEQVADHRSSLEALREGLD